MCADVSAVAAPAEAWMPAGMVGVGRWAPNVVWQACGRVDGDRRWGWRVVFSFAWQQLHGEATLDWGDDWPSAARSGCGKGLTRGRARSDSEPRLSVTLAGREVRFVPYMKLKTSHPRQTVYLGLVLYVVVQFSLWKGDNTDL